MLTLNVVEEFNHSNITLISIYKFLSKLLNDSRCGIIKKEEYFIDNSSDAKSWIMDQAFTEQPFLVAIRGNMNSIGHCIGVVQNMIF